MNDGQHPVIIVLMVVAVGSLLVSAVYGLMQNRKKADSEWD